MYGIYLHEKRPAIQLLSELKGKTKTEYPGFSTPGVPTYQPTEQAEKKEKDVKGMSGGERVHKHD